MLESKSSDTIKESEGKDSEDEFDDEAFSGSLVHDDITKIAFESNIDLREYSKQVADRLLDLEEKSFNSYVQAGPRVIKLYKQLIDCDSVLERMENILTNFHRDLGDISSNIQDLQERSMFMHQRLQNRQAIRGELSQYLSDMVVPETLIQHILYSNVTDQEFLENLHELDHKVKFVAHQHNSGKINSTNDVVNILKKLAIKAVTRIREYLLQKIALMRKPMENYQVPQNQMLKYRFYMEFLITHDRQTSVEIRTEYLNTMSKIYFAYFKEYIGKLAKLQIDLIGDKDDLLGRKLDDLLGLSVQPQVTSIPMTTPGGAMRSSISGLSRPLGVFSLGDRAANSLIDSSLDSPILVPHIAAKSETKFPIEVLFRSAQFALFDTSCREYFFLTDFFLTAVDSASSPELSSTAALFEEVLGKTIVWIFRQTELQIQQATLDVLGLLLCVQILHGLQRIALERELPILDVYWNNILNLLWSKICERLDTHCQSLRSVDVNLLAGACQSLLPSNVYNTDGNEADSHGSMLDFHIPPGGGAELAVAVRNASSVTLPAKALPLIRPHPLARRWAEFAAALHSVGHESPGTPWMHITSSQAPSASPPSSRKSTKKGSSISSGSSEGYLKAGPIVPLDSRILIRLSQMQDHFEAALNRMASAFPRLRLRLIFLINNYDIVITVLTEQGFGDSLEVCRCKEAISRHTLTFIDQALLPFFGSMLTFIRAAQLHKQQQQGQPATSRTDLSPVDETRINHIIRGFNIDWRNAIEKIHGEIINEFANFTIATKMFQALLTQLLQYYHEFQNAINEPPYNSITVRSQLVGIHELVNELKRFRIPY